LHRSCKKMSHTEGVNAIETALRYVIEIIFLIFVYNRYNPNYSPLQFICVIAPPLRLFGAVLLYRYRLYPTYDGHQEQFSNTHRFLEYLH
jgi:hypothetical protein